MLIGIAPQPVHAIADQLGGGLVAGDDHEIAEGDDLVVCQVFAVDLGVEQSAHQVGAGIATPLGDELGEVLAQLEEAGDAGRRDVLYALFALEHRVGPGAQGIAVVARHGEQLADDVHRQTRREVADDVELPRAAQRVEILGGQLADADLELHHPARREAARHEIAHAGVARRVHREKRRGVLGMGPRRRRVERDPVRVGEPHRVLEAGQHVGVMRQREEAELGIVIHRPQRAQSRVRRIRILVKPIVVGIEHKIACFIHRARAPKHRA